MTQDISHRQHASGFCLRVSLLLAAAGALACPTVRAADETQSCALNEPSRALDYWVGDWTVTTPTGGGESHSSVHLQLAQCVVIENWGDGEGHDGQNVFGYSQGDHQWRGMFFDNRGHIHVFLSGKVAGGVAEFQGPSLGEHGEAVLNRIRLARIAPDQLEQTWEKSRDNGRTWSPQFRLEYSRRSPRK
jgi:hypothetical protein